MALGCQMINFRRLNIIDQIGELAGVAQVAIVQKQAGGRVMGVHIQMFNAGGVKSAGPANQPMHFIPFGQEQFRQVTAILPGNPGN